MFFFYYFKVVSYWFYQYCYDVSIYIYIYLFIYLYIYMTCRSRCPDTGTLVCLDLHSISWVMLQFSTVVIPLTGVHCELNFLALTKIQTA